MTKNAASPADAPVIDELPDAIVEMNNNAASQAPNSLDPTQTGIAALRATDETAMKLWTVKGPKDTNSSISAVLMDGPVVVLLHQFGGGKFKVFRQSDV